MFYRHDNTAHPANAIPFDDNCELRRLILVCGEERWTIKRVKTATQDDIYLTCVKVDENGSEIP